MFEHPRVFTNLRQTQVHSAENRLLSWATTKTSQWPVRFSAGVSQPKGLAHNPQWY